MGLIGGMSFRLLQPDATRAGLPLARLRVGGQLTEVRVADLRFTASEAAAFLIQGMGLSLSTEDIAALQRRTEGWIAGLHLAAISLQGYADAQDATQFITSFTGSHHYVMDYGVVCAFSRGGATGTAACWLVTSRLVQARQCQDRHGPGCVVRTQQVPCRSLPCWGMPTRGLPRVS